jgi:hypothetical protein
MLNSTLSRSVPKSLFLSLLDLPPSPDRLFLISIRFLEKRAAAIVCDPIENFAAGYLDYLQAPLQVGPVPSLSHKLTF